MRKGGPYLRPGSCSRRQLSVAAWSNSKEAQTEPNRLLKASLDRILTSYLARTPSAVQVIDRVYKQGYGEDQLFHDHFAFRTFGVPGLGLESLGSALEAYGYTQQDYYTFPRTHLLAAWYAPPKELYEVLPRMFVSQLQIEKLSPKAQAIICSYTDELTDSITSGGNSKSAVMLNAWTSAITGTLPWRTPERDDYLTLLEETEYGAWVLVNGYQLNHTALSVHNIKGRVGDIYAFANELVMKGFDLNLEGGIMKVSPDSGLLQCSTVADVVDFSFAGGQVHPVVGAYMEFVERKPLPEHQHLAQQGQLREIHRRDGFEADSAKNIFASTTLAASQVQKQEGAT